MGKPAPGEIVSNDLTIDHSGLSETRGRLPHDVHETVFGWVLKLVAENGLVRGQRIGIDASTMEANAALGTVILIPSRASIVP
ncbi:MAG: hypothetical protein ACREFB_03680 [Stellaceae bacterium]